MYLWDLIITVPNTIINAGTYFGRCGKYFIAICHHQRHTTGNRRLSIARGYVSFLQQPLTFRVPVTLSVAGEISSMKQGMEKLFPTDSVMVVFHSSLYSFSDSGTWIVSCWLHGTRKQRFLVLFSRFNGLGIPGPGLCLSWIQVFDMG